MAPSHPAIGEWPLYEPERRATLLLGLSPGVVDAPMEAERSALEGLGVF